MKFSYFLISFLFVQVICAQEDPFPYERSWGSYFGSYRTTPVNAVVDTRGNIYILAEVMADGLEEQANSYSTPNIYQPEYGGGSRDAFLVKFDSTGNLVWATYYGGTGDESVTDIAIDENDNVYISGATDSADNISTPNAFQENLAEMAPSEANIRAGFLAKFSSQGELEWGTYYDGGRFDGIGKITFNNNFLYIIGTTNSSDNISTSGSFQENLNYNNEDDEYQTNLFVAKFNMSGSRLWATYYGPSDTPTSASLAAITTDNEESIYVLGTTEDETGFFATSGAYKTENQGSKDLFLTKFNSEGNLIWSTYYGGEDMDTAWDLELFNGALFVSGITRSDQHISTAGSYQETLSGVIDDFLLKMDIEGNPVWATYYGGSENEGTDQSNLDYLGGKISLSQDGNVWLSSGTVNLTSIATEGAYQEARDTSGFEGSADAYFVKFDQLGNRLYASYYGGGGSDGNSGVLAVDEDSFYIFGRTNSNTGIATENAYQASLPDGNYPQNIFLAKFVPKVLGTSDFTKTTFSIWPNPTQGVFTISGKANQPLQVSIYDLQGRRVWAMADAKVNQPIQLQNQLSSGVYFVKITGEKAQTQTLKLVVK